MAWPDEPGEGVPSFPPGSQSNPFKREWESEENLGKQSNRSALKGKTQPKFTAADLRRDREICMKWLKDRPGRSLTDDDLELCREIMRAVSETLRHDGDCRGHPEVAE